MIESNKVADSKNLKVVVGLQRHYQPSYIEGIERIHDGAFGDLSFYAGRIGMPTSHGSAIVCRI